MRRSKGHGLVSRMLNRCYGSSRKVSSLDCLPPPKVNWLDLRGSRISVLERLLLEEFLWKNEDSGTWLIVGHHEPVNHRYLKNVSIGGDYPLNPNAVIVLGIGGRPQKLLHTSCVQEDNVQVIKRFSGGGTVVLDINSIWTTVIGRNEDGLLDFEQRYPRPIMEWSMSLFGPLIEEFNRRNQRYQHHTNSFRSGQKKTMMIDSKSCGVENIGRLVMVPIQRDKDHTQSTSTFSSSNASSPLFAAPVQLFLRENDYVIGSQKVAGNAQSIGMTGWLHHTSWLWEYSNEHMKYLQLPHKRPDYRRDRNHADFLTTLQTHFPKLKKMDFYSSLKQVATTQFDLQTVTFTSLMSVLHTHFSGGMNEWMNLSRTKVISDL